MRRYARTMFLERLCELRAMYALRGDYDSSSVMSIDEAVRFASEVLQADALVQSPQALSAQSPA